MRVDIITLFPNMFAGPFGESIVKRALDRDIVKIHYCNPRDFTTDTHRTVDDRPYGGGPGMVMKPEPIFAAVNNVRTEQSHIVLLTPQGTPFKQKTAHRFASHEHLVLICGHYEGVDERVRLALVDEEISIGDYILTNGNLAAIVVLDATIRLLPGVLGCSESVHEESFSENLLEYPQYTRPESFENMNVPPVLLSGDHQRIADWRREQSVSRTRERRPDLLDQ